jgi:hypothetical protein
VLLLAFAFFSSGSGEALPVNVTTPDELLLALEDPSVAAISVTAPMTLPYNWGPAVVKRQLLVNSPIRAMIDFCDEQCEAGQASNPHIIVGQGGALTFNRLFFRHYIPPNKKGNYSGWDFVNSPAPSIVSQDGGQAFYNLVVWHWTKPMTWAFEDPTTFWYAARQQKLTAVGTREPLQLGTPALYNLKNFGVNPTAQIQDCYIPVDLDGCLTNQPFNTTLIYW